MTAAPGVYSSAERTAVPCAEPGAFNVFDLSITKLLVLAVLALLIFGPDQLPKVAAQAGRALRDLRRLADMAKADLKEGLGPEFADFDVNDLNPRNFVRKHLLDDLDLGFGSEAEPGASSPEAAAATAAASTLPAGESPPYDAEAT
ncbi:MAG: sec-independent translocase [Streptosporangiaceae bacterium]